jgi:citrate synthase
MQVYSRQYLQEFQHFGDLYTEANQAVLEMLEEIHQNGGDIDKYMAKAKDKDDPFRLMVLVIEYIKTLIHVLKSSKKAADFRNFRC